MHNPSLTLSCDYLAWYLRPDTTGYTRAIVQVSRAEITTVLD